MCDLLTAEPLSTAKRIARLKHTSCEEAAIQPAVFATASAAQRISQPLTRIMLISASPGPPHWFGYLEFTSPKLRSDSHDPRYTPLTLQIVKRSNGTWAINQIGYEF